MTIPARRMRASGFTLIELSIVIIIIGLILGGIAVGKDLIRAAEIRSTVSQIEQYNAAANTFRTKYNNLPGDVVATDALAFGFAVRAGGQGHGDGNGLIESGDTAAGVPQYASGETVLFWNDLGVANLIAGHYVGIDCGGFSGCTKAGPAVGFPPFESLLPPSKLGRGNYIHVLSDSGLIYYEIIGTLCKVDNDGGIYGMPCSIFSPSLGMTPQESYSIDSKIDDGYPNSGNTLSKSSVFHPGAGTGFKPGAAAAASAGDCGNTDTTPTTYNIAGAPDSSVCSISIRAGF